ncbi:MAG: V-type ATP synthase subunit F [Methanomassiliicoccales archaeon]|uniref:V-type ATP synthase subunit F n=1 Tax=Candidatus Methanarcanum hacksteinii TaxID=2911857 RepID=UPI0015A8DBB8|nr:V-type ATP synthase subunit F [Candidatus Methanomethylophilaceae archaeon]MCI6024512.1 V-type ATP synthase subunit F [Methanomassiliicoccales archaeon]MDY4579987.1 V-type ATP synthase subunit F [Candidatus Methanarcanum hacksteinii]MDD7478427.1 V-type ATP synthase subunit F [Methanomassiliicoccales archaeon]MDO5837435.1 V-type ATP synthase subunit F [Methanomassiliicoccales archaeon]
MDIAVIGNEEFVLGFRLAGLRRVFVAHPEDYQERIIEAMQDPEVGILAVDGEDLKNLTPQMRAKVTDSISPVIVTVGGAGMGDLREKIKRAIGVDLYKEDE